MIILLNRDNIHSVRHNSINMSCSSMISCLNFLIIYFYKHMWSDTTSECNTRWTVFKLFLCHHSLFVDTEYILLLSQFTHFDWGNQEYTEFTLNGSNKNILVKRPHGQLGRQLVVLMQSKKLKWETQSCTLEFQIQDEKTTILEKVKEGLTAHVIQSW